ncbi:TPR-like protein [Schizopora paradoxa]|uniref:TPR-like protein n=1 Tax=Schizopora paradoxa TaxID=27342 RepID=A0A0H2RRP6_9AGAM|nr:TPR-like protein [Schizopora paradoxa]
MSFEDIERALIIGKWSKELSSSEDSEIAKLAEKTIEGQFSEVLKSSSARDLLAIDSANGSNDLTAPFDALVALPTKRSGDSYRDELVRIIVGVACLHCFVQANWTGPDIDVKPGDVLLQSSASISEDNLNQKAIAELAYGGEPAYHLAQAATFLRISQIIFDLPFVHCKSASWWRFRTARIHQHVLDDPTPLPPQFISDLQPLYADFASQRDLAGRLSLEQGLLQHHHGNDKVALQHFIDATKYTGMEYELTGALGKRTKFQQTDLSQLVLLAESRNRDTESLQPAEVDPNMHSVVKPSPDPSLPETLALNDDTLLEQTEFTSTSKGASGSKLSHIDPSSQPALHPLDQCILLSLCLNVKNTSPSHGLTTEQMAPYVSRVVSHPQNWSIHTMALLLRSRLESSRTRTVERSTLQLQALVDQMPTADSSLAERLLYFHVLPLPSKWELEKELASRFLSLGVVKSALEIFERLEMWEEVVKCWQSMERPDKGISIVRDLLEGRKAEAETVISRAKTGGSESRRQVVDSAREAKLWCLLGDLEPHNAVEHYERAWSISRETSGRAMRSLGGFHFTHERYGDAIVCLRKAVAINPLLARSWFVLGCSYVREGNWMGARDAFVRCVQIDDEDVESWNNLATVYLRMGTSQSGDGASDKERVDVDENTSASSSSEATFNNKLLAFRALKQALKFSHDNWRVWANYMLVAMDVGDYFEACRAQARLVEDRSAKVGVEALDYDIIERLVDVVTRPPSTESQEENSAQETSETESASASATRYAHGLPSRVLDLFERTMLPRVSSQRLFRAYARLLTGQRRWADALKAYLDAYRMGRAATMEKGEELEESAWRDAVQEVEDIVDILRNFGPRVDAEEKRDADGESTKGGLKWEGQARSILRTFMARTKDNFEDDPAWEKLTQLQEELARN